MTQSIILIYFSPLNISICTYIRSTSPTTFQFILGVSLSSDSEISKICHTQLKNTHNYSD